MESPKKKQKTKGKWRLFRCFKPEVHVDDDAIVQKAKNADPIFTYFAVAEKSLKGNFNGEENVSRRKKMKEKSYSIRRALMSALNHTPLAKKMSYKHKTCKNGSSSQSSTNSSNTTFSLSSRPFTPSTLSSCSTNSTNTTISTETSGSSPELYLSRCTPINETGVGKQKQNIGYSKKRYFGNSNMGLCLLLITSLMILIICGKCCAIAYTSIGLFVVPNYWRRTCNKGIICEETDFISTSILYKKSIIEPYP